MLRTGVIPFFPSPFPLRAAAFFPSPCIPLHLHTLSVISPLRTPPLFSSLTLRTGVLPLSPFLYCTPPCFPSLSPLMPTPSAAFFLFSLSLNTCPCRCSFFPVLFCRASPFFFLFFPLLFPCAPPFFLLSLHAASHLGRYLASLYAASFFSSTASLLPPATALFSPLPFPCAPLLECHPELVSGSHYSIYPLVIVREMYEMPKRVRHDN